MKKPFFLGIDIGSQGIRIALIDSGGNVISQNENVFPLNSESRREQSPALWWNICLESLKKLTGELKGEEILGSIKSVAVTSTSGTVIPLDRNNNPIHNAIMYSDSRSDVQAKRCKELAEKHISDGYTGFNTSSGLSSMVWFAEAFPEKTGKLSRWVHAADFISGKLSGVFGFTDYTNALKSGFDPELKIWPSWIFEHLQLKREWLPAVVAPGTEIGTLENEIADNLGLAKTTKIVAGVTDGCASQIASGAVQVGDWNTTIGTTLVVKGVTRKRIVDPEGRLYSHLHPMGYWMPGGASNTGADWITQEFESQLQEFNRNALNLLPTRYISYPLKQKGERFPFFAPQAVGFEPEGLTPDERFTANMEGVAYLERYAYELICNLSGEQINAVYTAGGGSLSDAWLTIRSNVLKLPLYKMKNVSGAVGAAILAASKTHFNSIVEAVQALTTIEKEIYPESRLEDIYEVNYQNFLKKITEKGYIKGGIHA